MHKTRFSEQQKKIALALVNDAKTAEDLQKELKANLTQLSEDLKKMMKLELVEKLSGYPTKYELKKHIIQALQKRKEIQEKDAFKLRLKALIEVHAIEKTLVEKQLNEIIATLKKETDFTIYDSFKEEIVKEGEYYSTFLDVNLSVKDFRALMRLMFLYGPSSIEILKPEKWEISMDALQDGLMMVAETVQGYTDYIARKMNQSELMSFNAKLFGKAQTSPFEIELEDKKEK
ncbi:MAG: hypothetical protein Q7S21_06080 [archaeon]|nr:hypothetical protein [archaeon]